MVESIKEKLIAATSILTGVTALLVIKIPILDYSTTSSLTHLLTNGFHPWLSMPLPSTVEVWWLITMLLVAAILCFGSDLNAIAKGVTLTLLTVALFGGERLLLRSMLTAAVAIYLLDHSKDRKLIVLIALFTAWFVLGWSSIPDFHYPSYPNGARVVQDDGIAGLVRPLLGPDANIQIIDRVVLKEHYAPIALIVFLISLYPLLKGYFLASIFALLPLLDCILPESYAQLSPLQSFSRLFPYFLYTPITSCFLGLSLIFTIKRTTNIFFALILSVYALVFSQINFICNIDYKAAKICSLEEFNPLLGTPSANLILNYSEKRFKNYQSKLLTSKLHLETFRGVERLVDENDNSRLRLNGKTLALKFKELTKLSGVVLDPGAFYSDFPRSFTIKDLESGKVLYSTDNWQGSLRFEEKSKFPYYGPEQDMMVLFDEKIATRGISINCDPERQKPYDWSVAEFRIVSEE